jgi:HlyD family secretion protein
VLGQPATIHVNGVAVAGKVTRVNGSVENGTVGVDILPDGPLPEGVRPDLRVDGTIHIDNLANVLYVGKPSQLGNTENATVYVVDGDRAVRRPIQIGRRSSGSVQVLSGLNEGERVILSDSSSWSGSDAVEIR